MLSIRWRIALFVLLVVAGLQVLVSGYVLHRLARAQRTQCDDALYAELIEVQRVLESDDLVPYVRQETAENTKWYEDFIEIRDASGQLLVASKNVPAAGFGSPVAPEPLKPRRRGVAAQPVVVWEIPHPGSAKGHVHIRIAELRLPKYTIRVASSMKSFQKAYFDLREQLGWGLVAVSLLGGACGWWVARRSLTPVQALTVQARALGALAEGSLPRTGNGDELDRMAEVLNEMVDKIRAEVRRVRRLSADAAHALRTPLAVIRVMIEAQVRAESPQNAGALGGILEALDELSGSINQLLLLESLESVGLEGYQRTQIALDAVAREVCDALEIVALDRELKLLCTVEPAQVHGDAAQLRNAIGNLLDNALRHTPSGGQIQVSVCKLQNEALLAVTDTGPGLRPDQLERVFERFYSERAGSSGGLGLSIARAIAVAHGGSLRAASPGGARFELRLPLVR